MKKNKIIIIAAAISVIAVMTTVAILIKFIDRKTDTPVAPTVTDEVTEYIPSDTGWAEISVPPSVIGNPQGAPLPEVVAQSIEAKARELIQGFRFEEAEEYILGELSPYNIDNSPAYRQFVEPLRMDIPGMSQFDYLRDYGLQDTIVEVIEQTVDPVNLVVSALWLDEETREKIILHSSSLNPSYGRLDAVGAAKKAERTISGFYDVSAVYEIPVKLDGYSLTATVIDEYGWLSLYSIDENEGVESPYISIEEWTAIKKEYFSSDEVPEEIIEEPIEIPIEETEGA